MNSYQIHEMPQWFLLLSFRGVYVVILKRIDFVAVTIMIINIIHHKNLLTNF